MPQDQDIKHTIKDSVFVDFFGEKENVFRLYQALHPEDQEATIDEVSNVTLENIFTDDIYNDIGFTLGDRIVVLAEAQSTWSVNIIIRALEYLVHTYRRYFRDNSIDLYQSRRAKLPKPELYVIYTGNRKRRQEEIILSEEFFGGEQAAIEVKVKVIYDGRKGDVINQYVTFTRILEEQVVIYDRTKKAIQETIRICKDEDVMREYLEKKESEVVDIMMQLYDQEEVWRIHVLNRERNAAICTAVEMCQDFGMGIEETVEKIAAKFHLSKDQAEEEVDEYWKESV